MLIPRRVMRAVEVSNHARIWRIHIHVVEDRSAWPSGFSDFYFLRSSKVWFSNFFESIITMHRTKPLHSCAPYYVLVDAGLCHQGLQQKPEDDSAREILYHHLARHLLHRIESLLTHIEVVELSDLSLVSRQWFGWWHRWGSRACGLWLTGSWGAHYKVIKGTT